MFEQTHVIYLILFSLIALIVVMYPLRKHTRLLCVIVPAIIIFIWSLFFAKTYPVRMSYWTLVQVLANLL